MQVDYSKKFLRNLKKSPRKTRVAFKARLELFVEDKHHPLLNNHALSGKFRDYRSINITGDWRAIFREFSRNGEVVVFFVTLGTHSELYF